MPKNKLHIHLIIFLILLVGTSWFVYQSFAPPTNSKKTKILNETKQEVQSPKETNLNTEQDKTKTVVIPQTTKQLKQDIELNTNNPLVSSTTEQIPEKIPEPPPYSATITVTDKNYQVGFDKEGIILKDLMDKLQNESDFIFSGVNYSGIGFFVNEINNIKNNNKENKYWVYYINGMSANVGISSQKINSGDNIKWSYENSTF